MIVWSSFFLCLSVCLSVNVYISFSFLFLSLSSSPFLCLVIVFVVSLSHITLCTSSHVCLLVSEIHLPPVKIKIIKNKNTGSHFRDAHGFSKLL